MRYLRQSSLVLPLLTTYLASPLAAKAQVTFGNTISEYVQELYKWSIGAGIALAVIMLIYAGYTMVTSAGDPSKVGFAKEVIVGSLSGLALLAGAALVLNLLSIT